MTATATATASPPLSSAFNSCRMNRVSVRFNWEQSQKDFISFASIRNRICKTKLFIIPSKNIHICSAFGGSKDSQRSVLPRVSKKTLDNDILTDLEDLFKDVKSLVKKGKRDDAIELLEANFEAVKEQIDSGSKGMEEAAILDVVALGYMFIEDIKMVESALDMLHEIVLSLEDDEPLLDLVLIHMGSMYAALGKSEKSILVYRRGIEIMERNYGSNSTFLVTPMLGLGKVLSYIGRGTKAIEIYQSVITILETNKGEECEELIVPLLALGELLLKDRKAADSEKYYTRILNICLKIYGEKDERVAVIMRSLADVKCAKGEVDEAVELCKNGIEVLKHSCKRLDDKKLEKMRIDLAELLHSVGRVKEGRAVLEECVMINLKSKGKENPSSVNNLMNLANSYTRSKNYVESERLLRTCVSILTKSMGPDHPSTSFPMLNLAVTLYSLKKYEEAEQIALEVLRIRESAFGKDSVPVGEALDCLVSIQSKLDRGDELLLERLKRVMAIQEKAFGSDSKKVFETLKKVVFFLDRMGKKDEKRPLQKRLSVLINKHKNMIPL